MSKWTKILGLAVIVIGISTQTGCDELFGIFSEGYALGSGYGYGDSGYGYGDSGSLIGGGYYDDGSYGNWLSGNYVSTGSDGTTAIDGDGFYCLDGVCSVD